jgi:hypothetical protein
MWGTLSYHLLNQIETFLPPPEKISQLVDTSTPPLLLHSDINDENIMGNALPKYIMLMNRSIKRRFGRGTKK